MAVLQELGDQKFVLWKIQCEDIADTSRNCHHRNGGGVLFSSGCLFLHREHEMLSYFGLFGYFVANLGSFWCALQG